MLNPTHSACTSSHGPHGIVVCAHRHKATYCSPPSIFPNAHLRSPMQIWLIPDSMTFWCSTGTPVTSASLVLISSLLALASMSMVTSDPQARCGVIIFTCQWETQAQGTGIADLPVFTHAQSQRQTSSLIQECSSTTTSTRHGTRRAFLARFRTKNIAITSRVTSHPRRNPLRSSTSSPALSLTLQLATCLDGLASKKAGCQMQGGPRLQPTVRQGGTIHQHRTPS